MENTLKLVGKNSNEIFTLRYPSTLVDFCEFDFSLYAQEAIAVCNEALKTGSLDYDKISEIKKDIQSAHCFMQYSTKTTYDKIVFDCWIDYVCRRDNIGNSALWNRFIRCKTPFEKLIFGRLCDFRYKRAVNEWLNVIRIQDYAKCKLNFVFTDAVKSVEEAEERKNYFDLIFSVTARELGCRLDELGVTKYYSVGRTPGSPFMFPNISKEIVRHVLAGFDYSDDYSDINDYAESADEVAMDAFSRMKAGLPQDPASYTIPTGKLENLSDRIYMPCGLKAVIDLEIDALLESGMWLKRCKNCGRFFAVSVDEYKEYCTRRNMPSGKTCIGLFEEQNPRPVMSDALVERCRLVTDEMYSRVDSMMSVEEYNSWRTYLEAMKQKVENGEIAPAELESFLEYSRGVDITKSKPIVEVPKREPEAPKERVVRPFVPERISRSEIKQYHEEDEEELPVVTARPTKEGFFTSPSVERQKSERPQVSHIIRNGESLGENANSLADGVFRPFEPQAAEPYASSEQLKPQGNVRRDKPQERERNANFKPLKQPVGNEFVQDYLNSYSDMTRAAEQENIPHKSYSSGKIIRGYNAEPVKNAEMFVSGKQSGFSAQQGGEPISSDNRGYDLRTMSNGVDFEKKNSPVEQFNQFEQYEKSEQFGNPAAMEETVPVKAASAAERGTEEIEPQRTAPRVIKKNAAAISAYGKMSNQTIAAAPTEQISSNSAYPNQANATDNSIGSENGYEYRSEMYSAHSSDAVKAYEQPQPVQSQQLDSEMLEPFKDIESIFDVLEQSESNMKSSRRYVDDYADGYGHSEKNVEYVRNAEYAKRNSQRDVSAEDYISPANLAEYARSERYEQYEQPWQSEHSEQYFQQDKSEQYSEFALSERSEQYGHRTLSAPAQPDRSSQAEPPLPGGYGYSDNRNDHEEIIRNHSEQPVRSKRSVPERPLRNDEAPSGIWTEDRGLFRNEPMPMAEHTDNTDYDIQEKSEPEKSEIDMIREKRHSTRSSKTQRLYDVIMREPDDNPNFRKKR